jgi:hypothetical protein
MQKLLLLILCQHSRRVVVSFPVEEETNQGLNPCGSKKKKKILSWQPEK